MQGDDSIADDTVSKIFGTLFKDVSNKLSGYEASVPDVNLDHIVKKDMTTLSDDQIEGALVALRRKNKESFSFNKWPKTDNEYRKQLLEEIQKRSRSKFNLSL